MGWGWGWTGDCGCCGDGPPPPVDCHILVDNFARADAGDLGPDWDEDSGTWAIASGNAETGSSDARAITVGTLTSGADPSHLSVLMSGAYGGILIFDYADANNYHYIERRSGGSFGVLHVFVVTSGSSSSLGSINLITGDYSSGALQLVACVQSDRLTLNLGGNRRNAQFEITAHGGDRAGIGTLTISGTAIFESFAFSRRASILAPECPTCVSDCSSGLCLLQPPEEYLIDMGPPGFMSNNFCEHCDDIGGEFILIHRAVINTPCSWIVQRDYGCGRRVELCGPSGLFGPMTIRLVIANMFPGFSWFLTIRHWPSVLDGSCGNVLDFFQADYISETFPSPLDCHAISELPLDKLSENVVGMCDGSFPATIHLSSMP